MARIAAVRQQVDAQVKDDPAAAYLARLQQIKDSGHISGRDGLDDSAPELIDADSKRPDNNYANLNPTGKRSR